MHELAITQSLVDAVLDDAGECRVRAVHASVGKISGVVPDAMRFCFDIATQGTTLEGAELIIDEPAGTAHCRTCDRRCQLPDLILLCSCGSADLEVITGRELSLRSYEVV